MKLISSCVCGNETDFSSDTVNSIPVRICNQCGVMHQDLDMTPEQYFNFYATEYHTDFQQKRGTPTYEGRYKHDTDVAIKRYKEYHKGYLTSGGSILDIGSSNNAFVDYMRTLGYKAYGVEIGSEGAKHPQTTYNKDLLDIHFPPKMFSLVTLHDVFEHFIDPIPYLKEIHKILDANGTLIIDFPNFFEPAGLHHWKPVEHLWFFSLEQMKIIFDEYGFVVDKVEKPIESKFVFYLKKKPEAKQVKLLFMPGMGDIYWPLTKVESFIKENNLGTPESYIWDLDQKKIGSKQRSEGFLDRFPFMEYKGVFDCRITPTFDKFYEHKGGNGIKVGAQGQTKNPRAEPNWFIQNEHGFDYIFNVNGILEIGDSIVDSCNTLRQYETNWQPTMFESVEFQAAHEHYKQKYGKYIFCYFTGTGNYDSVFNANLTPELVARALQRIHEATGAVAILTGTTWDANNAAKIMKLATPGTVYSEVNSTTSEQLLALMKGSVGIIGWPAGNTIVSASYYHKPSIVVWSDTVWHREFATQCVDPTNKKYFPLYVDDYAKLPQGNQLLSSKIVDLAIENFEK